MKVKWEKDTSIFTFSDSFSEKIIPGKVAIAEVKLNLVWRKLGWMKTTWKLNDWVKEIEERRLLTCRITFLVVSSSSEGIAIDDETEIGVAVRERVGFMRELLGLLGLFGLIYICLRFKCLFICVCNRITILLLQIVVGFSVPNNNHIFRCGYILAHILPFIFNNHLKKNILK